MSLPNSCNRPFSASFKWKMWGAIIHQLSLKNYFLKTMRLDRGSDKSTTEAFQLAEHCASIADVRIKVQT